MSDPAGGADPGSQPGGVGGPEPGGADNPDHAPETGTVSFTDDLFAEVVERGPVRPATSDQAWVAAMLRAEGALALAEAELGIVPQQAADEVAAACARPAALDPAVLARDTALGGNPVIPLVDALRAMLSEAASEALHHGATSQDILDTATMLLARDAIGFVRQDLAQSLQALQSLSEEYGDVPTAGRTLMQQALPITFGAKTETWSRGLSGAGDRLARTAGSLPAQLGGPVGTRTSFGTQGDALSGVYAARLGLAPGPCWHTVRLPVADLAGAFATTAGVVEKLAADVILMAQQEVGEVREVSAVRGGSSSMAHKSNPVAAVSARASARRAPALAGHLFAAMAHEHERAAGPWHSEWMALVDLMRCTGSATAWLADCLTHLQVDPEALRRNA